MDDMFEALSSMNEHMIAYVHGVYVGKVTNNNDPENLGRVKVKIPVLDNENELDWARVATLMAGAGRGTLFLPEVGDEVLVAFHMGDIRQPIVIGSLWNKVEAPPSGKDDKNNIRKITSRSKHEIILNDTDGDGKLTLKTAAGHQLEMSEKSDTVQLTDKNKQNTLTIKGSGEIELKSGATKIVINSQGDVTIESAKSLKLKSAQITVEANATLDLKGAAALNLKSDGVIAIKGSLVQIN
jgi:uncharacterized protein involved in type VI secretion and phage assembly